VSPSVAVDLELPLILSHSFFHSQTKFINHPAVAAKQIPSAKSKRHQ